MFQIWSFIVSKLHDVSTQLHNLATIRHLHNVSIMWCTKKSVYYRKQCNSNIFDYSNIRILGGEYFVFEYEYCFSPVRIYLIFIFDEIDLTNVYSGYIRYVFGWYSAYIRYIFEYQAPNIHYSNTNILFHWNEYIRYLYSVKI